MITLCRSEFRVRGFREGDRPAVRRFNHDVIDWWRAAANLHLVALPGEGGKPVGQLQVVDRSTTATRRPGRCEMRLFVAPEFRGRGIGRALMDHALRFGVERGARSLRAAYLEEPDNPARGFLDRRGFVELQRYHASHLDPRAFDSERWDPLLERVRARGVRILTYAEVADTRENRRRIYELDTELQADIPLVETEPMEPEPFESWEADFAKKDFSAVFLAERDGDWIGMVTGLNWPFTGVRRGFRGRGIATALKVYAIRLARERGLEKIETENCSANAPMLAVNRKLGFVFGTPEVEMIRWRVGMTR
jgi:GNAT superfamily N-acetyltransferase